MFDDATGILAAADIDHVLAISRQNERPVIAQQTLASTGIPAYRAISRLYASGERDGVFEVEAGGRDWVVWMTPLALDRDRDATLTILAPSDVVFADVNKRMRFSLMIAGLGIGIGLFLPGWSLMPFQNRSAS